MNPPGSVVAAKLHEGTASTARIQLFAMATGTALFAGFVLYSRLTSVRAPELQEIRAVNFLTAAAMLASLTVITASEFVWRGMLLKIGDRDPNGPVQTAFIVRSAMREGAATFGGVVALVAALNGTLRVYPAYWVNLAPALLFVGYAYFHWPTLERLRAEVEAVLPR